MPLKVLMSLLWSAYLPVKKRKDLEEHGKDWKSFEILQIRICV